MSFDINLNVNVSIAAPALQALLLNTLLPKLEQILMNETEALAKLDELGTKLDQSIATGNANLALAQKISGETTGLLVEIQTLKDLAGQQPGLSQAFTDKLAAVFSKADGVQTTLADAQTALTGVDNLVPDPAA